MFPVESEVTQSSLSLTIKTTDFHTDRTFVVSVLAEITRYFNVICSLSSRTGFPVYF